jgi:uncharacterized SAM-binding protein YcdF (DUF218 family)
MTKPWSKLVLIATALLAGYFLVTTLLPALLNVAARQLIRKDQLEPADAILALGGDSLCLREGHAAELYHRRFGRKIIISGLPFAWGGNTGDAKRQFLLCRGVPDSDIIVLPEAWNTRAEASNLLTMMRERGWRSVIVVTSPFHTRRALYTIERLAAGQGEWRFYAATVPAQPPEWQPQRWWTRRRDMFATVREFLSWGNTLVGGWQ